MSTDAPLKVDPAQLPQDVGVLQSLVVQLVDSLQERDRRIAQLERHMDLLARKVFGRSSEKLDPRQLALFAKQDDAAIQAVIPSPTPAEKEPSAAGQRRSRGRRRAGTLERREVIYDLSEAEKQVLAGDGELVPIGEQVSEQYEWEPSCLYVLRHVQKKYARRPALVESGASPAEKNVVTAAKPPQPIIGGSAGPGLLAYVVTSRFCDHLPYHRQERIFERHGLRLSRQTTCGQARQLAELCQPLYELMIAEVLGSAVLHSDDTPVKVRDAHHKRQYTGRFWNYVGDLAHPLTVFVYTPDRSRDGPAKFLKNYRGFLQADAYSGYDPIFANSNGAIVEVACWAHARRNFFEARQSDPLRAETALAYIRELYLVERELRERSQGEWSGLAWADRAAQIAGEREQRARPVLAQFSQWMDQQAPALLPKEPLRQAIEYARHQWVALCRYCDDGRLDIDNNAAEQAIRGIALGRKNWLFCGSDRGGQTAAVHFSLIASCAQHRLDPFGYLRDIYARLPVLLAGATSRDTLRSLLPDRWTHP